MEGSIQLSGEERKSLLSVYRYGKSGSACRQAHILLLLADGFSYRHIRSVTYASFGLIHDCVERFRDQGVGGFLEQQQDNQARPTWLKRILSWVTRKTPENFGYFRTRWSCECLAEVLAWETGTRLSAETIRRGLHRAGYVWRRPRPVVGPIDPEYDCKLQKIRELLNTLARDETAVFQDEVDVHLNPKIGSCWMPVGQQSEVRTPGNNVKCHLAGSLVWRTGTLLVSPAGWRRNTDLFLAHLDDLRSRLRSYRVIHVICDNAPFHASRKVKEYLKRWEHRIRLHYLPKYAPETNPIERVWWRLHETITRNHQCKSMNELLTNVYEWIDTKRYFYNFALAQYRLAA
jgi:putative transposase